MLTSKKSDSCCYGWLEKLWPRLAQAEDATRMRQDSSGSYATPAEASRRPECLALAESGQHGQLGSFLLSPPHNGQSLVSWSEVTVRGSGIRLEKNVTCMLPSRPEQLLLSAGDWTTLENPKAVVMVVFQHGSHGFAADFNNIRKDFVQNWQQRDDLSKVPVVLWSTPDNEGLRTDDGLETCGNRLVSALHAGMKETSGRYPSAQLVMVFVAHSFGGLLLRYALSKLFSWRALQDVKLAAFVTLSSPHLGAIQMPAVLHIAGRGLGAIMSTAYSDLLLDSPAVGELCSRDALESLALFRHRILYACSSKDHLVSFETGGLTVPVGSFSPDAFPPAAKGHPHVREGLLLDPFELSDWDPTGCDAIDANIFHSCVDLQRSNTAVAMDGPTRVLTYTAPDGRAIVSQITEAAEAQQCQAAFKRFDDERGHPEKPISERAAQMLYKLRSVGRWVLHIVDFSEESIVVAHSAVINHPSHVKNPGRVGDDVSAHVADKLCAVLRAALHADV